MKHTPPSTKQSGISLIEVLVAMLIASLGFLSMIAMQVNATKYTKASEYRTMGTLLIGDLADRMRANRAGYLANLYTFTDDYPEDGAVTAPDALSNCNEPSNSCTAAEMAAQDMNEWRRAVSFALPGGYVRVNIPAVVNGNNTADVWLLWQDPQSGAALDGIGSECPAAGIPKDATVTPRCMHFVISI